MRYERAQGPAREEYILLFFLSFLESINLALRFLSFSPAKGRIGGKKRRIPGGTRQD
jgi:hypothetical protein